MRMRTTGWLHRMRHVSLARPGTFKVVAVATTVVAAGVTAGSAAAGQHAAGQQAVSLRLGYICAFPSASQPVSALVTATFPAAGTAGKPIRPAGAQIAVTLPRAAVAGLVRPGTPAVTGPSRGPLPRSGKAVTLTASLSITAAQGTRSVTVLWPHFRSPSAAIPRRGPLTLTASGVAAPVTASSPGRVTFSAAGLSLLFTATAAVGPKPPFGTPGSSSRAPGHPAGIRAECLPRAGQGTTLASVAVTGPKQAKVTTGDHPAKCLPFPKHLKFNPRFPLPKPLPGSRAFRSPEHGCSYAAGYTNARKLKEAALVGPGLTDLRLGLVSYTKSTKAYFFLQQNVAAQLEFHGRPMLPPARATLLAFGFTPVSATLQISEVGSLNAAFIACSPNPPGKCPKSVVVRALFFGRVNLRISNVDVNGVPLNVGPHCQTVSPFNMKLVGLPPAYDPSTISGVLTGFVTVPKFKGCADGVENLDPIFDSTVSGPGNFVKINQAPFCTPKTGGGCPPVKAKPVH